MLCLAMSRQLSIGAPFQPLEISNLSSVSGRLYSPCRAHCNISRGFPVSQAGTVIHANSPSNLLQGAIVDNLASPDPNASEFAGQLPAILPTPPSRSP